MSEALRVTFEYDEDRIEVRSIRRIAMRVPPGSRPRRTGGAGQAVELRSAEGEVLYRRAGEVIPRTIEYPTGDADRPFGRVPAPRRGVASVLVPVDERARSVAIVETRRLHAEGDEERRAEAAASDLVTVDLQAGHYETTGR
jgi:hypothetical protein